MKVVAGHQGKVGLSTSRRPVVFRRFRAADPLETQAACEAGPRPGLRSLRRRKSAGLTDPRGLASQSATDLANAIRNNSALIQKYGKGLIKGAINAAIGGIFGIQCADEFCIKRPSATFDRIIECCSFKVAGLASSRQIPCHVAWGVHRT